MRNIGVAVSLGVLVVSFQNCSSGFQSVGQSDLNSRVGTNTNTPNPSPAPASTPTASCSGAPNTPGGPDPFGGCFPGPNNTGVPAGATLTAYSGSCDFRSDNVVVDSKTLNCDVFVYGKNLTIKNSLINGTVIVNAATASVTILDSTLKGGSAHAGVLEGYNATILRADISGGEHSVHCGQNCVVRDSYLHDQYTADPSWHQNGFLSNGGSNYTIVHNSVQCIGACTADIALLNDGSQADATVDKNLLVATTSASYCAYPAGGTNGKPGITKNISWTDNIFQRGANGKCAQNGPVYFWNSQSTNPNADGYQNLWNNNKWDDGGIISAD